MKEYTKINGNLQPKDTKIAIFSTAPAQPYDGFYFIIGDGLYYSGTQIVGAGVSAPGVVGEIRMLFGTTAPSCWHICDGSLFDETVYTELYSVLGDNHYPDMRELTVMGASSDTGYGVGSFKDDAFPHTHGQQIGTHGHTGAGSSHTHSSTVSGWNMANGILSTNGTSNTIYADNTTTPRDVLTSSGSVSMNNASLGISYSTSNTMVGVDTYKDVNTKGNSAGITYVIYVGE